MDGYNAIDELKRVDHLIFVTLKYTRTVDIIRNILQRLVSSLDYQITDVLEYFKLKGKISMLPNVPLVRCKMMEELYPKDKEVKDIIDFYCKLRVIVNSEYKKKEEYRKNVALVTAKAEVDIDKLKLFAEKTKNYIYYLKGLIE
ncbi:MAG: hypothetical protein KKA65_01150 [Nanoarchaeota archaeon]|nr:hypothetical protein [Nanoarchaeota archaeon]MBU4242548.1 hypothetical protein [Nanoarchaeota archaeon]MBU4352641.1 hypothetical protein [Nanoarchaeota archaeon]MBU4456086.1 hypothetical protein [Nanoarchaeota archaeon]MCG2719924.1 hypothetical protein [Nanoarchaeota archaeon]